MARPSPLIEIARAIARDLASPRPSEGTRSIGLLLVDQPGSCETLLDLLVAEGRRTRPDDHAIGGLLYMIGQVLTAARMRAEQARVESPLVSAFRSRLKRVAAGEELDPDMLLAIAQQFSIARLDIGDDLRDSLMALSETAASSEMRELSVEDLGAMLGDVARNLGADPFLIHVQLAETFSAFPAEAQGTLVDMLAASDVPAMREAVLGWVLDPNVAVARGTAAVLEATAGRGLVSGVSASRLTMMRDWVAAEIRPSIDAASRAVRRKGEAATAAPAMQIGTVLASGCDGSGAQTFIVLGKQGRRHAMASLLVKQGFGVRDAFVHGGLSKRKADEARVAIEQELDPFEVSLDLVRTALENALAVNAAEGAPPPFGLVHVLEVLGWGAVHAAACPPEALVRQLLAGLPPERTSPVAVTRALAASGKWPERLVIAQSWFEEIEGGVPGLAAARTKKLKKGVILAEVLVPRRSRWAGVLAWTAAAAKDDTRNDDWIDLALVAREWLSDRPLGAIPVAGWIAENTLEALRGR